MILFLSLLAVLAYFVVTTGLVAEARGLELSAPNRRALWLLAMLGCALHAVVVTLSLIGPNGLHLGVGNAVSVVACCLVLIVLVGRYAESLDNLAVALLPIAAAAVLLDLLVPGTGPVVHSLSFGLGLHVLTSLVAYSLFSLAALQALWLALASRGLRRHRPGWMLSYLPPLARMESLLFRLLGAGFLLLSVSLVSGSLYVHDLFAQHLIHKTVLSIAAWLVFGCLLAGRWLRGWRGRTAIRFTFAGFALLLLAYFGSKVVLEWVLQRV